MATYLTSCGRCGVRIRVGGEMVGGKLPSAEEAKAAYEHSLLEALFCDSCKAIAEREAALRQPDEDDEDEGED